MPHKIIRYSILVLASLAVLVPLWIRARSSHTLFPMLGMAAFSLLWLHIVGPAFEPWLSKYVNFERFLQNTSPLILLFMLLHPLLFLFSINFDLHFIVLSLGNFYIELGLVGLLLLLTFDVGKAMRKKDFVAKHWNKILFTSTIGFVLIFFHSVVVGEDLQAGFLRGLWIFYGVSAMLSIIYVYGIKRFLTL
ncbi:hypothetical protein KW785_02400 [Candidatus Parcubacteria bacterium]|nr:hypothetical protein [Candidatus Parcubacteria bacterium]